MAHLKVGDKDCEFNWILREMKKSGIFNEIVTKREDIAVELNIDQEVQDIMNKNYKLLDEGALPIMKKYLVRWRSALASEATLGKLLTALDNCSLGDLSEKVRESDFYKKASKKVRSDGADEKEKMSDNKTFERAEQNSEVDDEQGIILENEKIGKDESANQKSDHTDGLGTWLSKTILKTGKITKHEWSSRSFVAGDNCTVVLKKRQHNEPKLGQEKYKLPGRQNGYALILNIIRYPNCQEPYRFGAQYDSLKLTQLLTQLNYEVFKFDDPNYVYTQSDVETIIRQFRDLIQKKEIKPASVIVFVGGHGKYGKIDVSEGKPVDLFESIIYQFDLKICEMLKNVPKIFIVNSCRVPHRIDSITNKIEDAVICYAALPQNYAYRNPETGSHFVNSFVKIVAENAHITHFTSMMKMVSKDVKNKVFQPPGETPSNELQQPMHEKLGDFGKLYFNVY